jgi:hypothetical protein
LVPKNKIIKVDGASDVAEDGFAGAAEIEFERRFAGVPNEKSRSDNPAGGS